MGSTKERMTPEEALELAELLAKISKIELKPNRPEAELVEDLMKDKVLRRGPKGIGLRKPKKKPLHWKTRRKKAREVYHAKGKQQRMARKIKKTDSAEGWYKIVNDKWRERSIPYFTLEEWLQVIWPALGGRVPCFTRYDTSKGFLLENIVVREDKVGTVLFDGMEYRMWRKNYIVSYTGQVDS